MFIRLNHLSLPSPLIIKRILFYLPLIFLYSSTIFTAELVPIISAPIKSIDIAAYTAFSVAEDEAKAIAASKQVVAFIVAGSPETVLERHGINFESASRIRELIVSGRFDEAFKSVTMDMIDAFSVSGSPSSVAKRVEECLKAGVTQFVVGSPIGPQPYEAMKIIGSKIIPMFKTG